MRSFRFFLPALFFLCLALVAHKTVWAYGGENKRAETVSPEAYRLLAEKDRVKILDVRLIPTQKTKMHWHPDAVTVVLSPGTLKFTSKAGCRECEKAEKCPHTFWLGYGHTCPLGKAKELNLSHRGEVVFQKAGWHVVENVGSSVVSAIVVEFKGKKMGQKSSLPKPHKRVGSNAHALAYELIIGPGEIVPEHTHADHVIVSLANGRAEIYEGGNTFVREFRENTVATMGPATHWGKNIGKTQMHLIDIELK